MFKIKWLCLLFLFVNYAVHALTTSSVISMEMYVSYLNPPQFVRFGFLLLWHLMEEHHFITYL